MTQEEKARKYDVALANARQEYNTIENVERKQWLEELFPELIESEDERIRKALITFFNRFPYDSIENAGTNAKETIAWLEKQKATNEEIVFRPLVGTDIRIAAKQSLEKIEIGKKVVLAFNGAYIPVNGKTVGEIENEYDAWLEKQGEQKSKWDDKNSKVNDETNAPTGYGKYVDECLNEASKHFFSEGEDKYSVADLFYAGVRCGKSWLEKQGEHNKWKPSKDGMDALYGLAYITNKMDNKKDEAITKLYQDLKREFFDASSYENMFPSSPIDAPIKDEKQRKQKPADKVEPKFKVGDWVIDKQGIVHKIANVIENVTYHTYGYDIVGGGYFNDNTEGVRLWTIQDAKKGDVLIYNGIVKYSNEIKYKRICLFNNLDNAFFTLTRIPNYVEEYNIDVNIDYPDNTVPATKEQKEILFMAMKNAGYEFDFKKKELKKIKQKTFLQKCFNAEYERGKNDAIAWSKEDNANKIKLKFNIGDWVIITTEKDEHTVEIIDISYFRSGHPMYITSEGRWFGNGTKARLWNINYAKDGDTLCYDDEVFIYKNFDNSIGYYACWDGKNIHLNSFYLLTLEEMKTIKPTTKEQRRELLKHLNNAGYIWVNERKELFTLNKDD